MPLSREKAYLLRGVVFEWDGEKARQDVRKHGARFEEATRVFLDDLGRIFDDPDHSEDESRFLLVGMSSRQRELLVVSVERRVERTDHQRTKDDDGRKEGV